MAVIVAGKLNDLPLEIRRALGTYRYEVFARRLGWTLPSTTGNAIVEWDQFDGGDTVHIVALDSRRQVCGSARLLPTTAPYLLEYLLPASSGLVFPSSPTVWELSRFAGSIAQNRSTDMASGMQLFPLVLAIAMSLGATCVIGAVTRAIARLYRRFGLDLQCIGPEHGIPGFPFLVCAIALTTNTFVELGLDPDVLVSTVTWCGIHAGKTPSANGCAPVRPALPGQPCCANRTFTSDTPSSISKCALTGGTSAPPARDDDACPCP
ncbi:putative autoinducer synthesis protein [Burkholderia ambifaria IOP40-10]|uniref:Acyl-homoserine-lactone synthase n=1 Tax=Burkholderia ambifaria IOP40-10 TaxID=396596 RepID=B1FHX7_9BURK|nr:acyl-homoserine-lactone synthase [Burkholderia ambifaria]EDT02848.1 putative autoinducer synthesis protein [Burkholderia ambifaria IOP40-10]